MKTKTFYLISTEGLNEAQIKFLSVCEKFWLKGKEINTNFLITAFETAGFQKGCPEAESVLETWYYFTMLSKPALRKSVKNPVKLSSILKLKTDGRSIYKYGDYSKILKGDLRETFQPEIPIFTNDYYFEIINDTRLYLKHSSIIASTFVAIVDNDLF